MQLPCGAWVLGLIDISQMGSILPSRGIAAAEGSVALNHQNAGASLKKSN